MSLYRKIIIKSWQMVVKENPKQCANMRQTSSCGSIELGVQLGDDVRHLHADRSDLECSARGSCGELGHACAWMGRTDSSWLRGRPVVMIDSGGDDFSHLFHLVRTTSQRLKF
jgi:hypothetical protein